MKMFSYLAPEGGKVTVISEDSIEIAGAALKVFHPQFSNESNQEIFKRTVVDLQPLPVFDEI